MREHRRIGSRRLHACGTEGCRRVLDQGDVVTELHAKTPGGFDATVGDQADENDLLNAVLLELEVEIGVGETALRPMLLDDDVTVLGAKLRIELAAPRTDCEGLGWQPRLLKHVDVLPPIELAFM